MKSWFAKQWMRFKSWAVAVLVAIGLVAAPLVMAVPTDFTYTRATTRIDGSPLAVTDIAETRLYCDGVLAASELGADQSITGDLSVGQHNCYATHVDADGQESDPSNTVVRVVTPARPSPPVLD